MKMTSCWKALVGKIAMHSNCCITIESKWLNWTLSSTFLSQQECNMKKPFSHTRGDTQMTHRLETISTSSISSGLILRTRQQLENVEILSRDQIILQTSKVTIPEVIFQLYIVIFWIISFDKSKGEWITQNEPMGATSKAAACTVIDCKVDGWSAPVFAALYI